MYSKAMDPSQAQQHEQIVYSVDINPPTGEVLSMSMDPKLLLFSRRKNEWVLI